MSYNVFTKVVNCTFGFRECLLLIKLAEETECRIELHVNGKVGSTDSILSLVQLGIIPNTIVAFSIKGENQVECIHSIVTLFEEGWQNAFSELITLN